MVRTVILTKESIGPGRPGQLSDTGIYGQGGRMITPAALIFQSSPSSVPPGEGCIIIEEQKGHKMEPRAKTLIERLGFMDPDRKKYKHDEIQIWVYHNFRRIIKQVFPLLEVDDNLPLEIKLEYPVCDNGGYKNFIVGFVDVYCQKLAIGVEIKTEMPIIGELIRQIQFYRKYVNGSWIVVSPDDRNSGILKDQGIYFFKYSNKGHSDQLQLFQ